jgi:hypothetical protein
MYGGPQGEVMLLMLCLAALTSGFQPQAAIEVGTRQRHGGQEALQVI